MPHCGFGFCFLIFALIHPAAHLHTPSQGFAEGRCRLGRLAALVFALLAAAAVPFHVFMSAS